MNEPVICGCGADLRSIPFVELQRHDKCAELRPCPNPWCKGKPSVESMTRGPAFVKCTCGVKGPTCGFEQGKEVAESLAIAAWNTRHNDLIDALNCWPLNELLIMIDNYGDDKIRHNAMLFREVRAAAQKGGGQTMNCPHCHKALDSAQMRKALNSEIAKRKRPGAMGLVRNPKGRPKA